ncbi:MAG: MFS transporter [Nitrososphaeria archaeon]|nr:MFS transporter [Nitrososphaeria archaeon]
MVVSICRFSVAPLAPFIVDELRFSHAEIGLLTSAVWLAYVVCGVPGGLLVDRFGIRFSTALGVGVAGTSTMLFVGVSTVIEGFTYRFISGLGSILTLLTTTVAVIVWFSSRERATMMGLKQTGVNIGGILAGLLLPSLAIYYSWRAGFLVSGGLGVIVSIFAFLFIRELPQRSKIAETQMPTGKPIGSTLRNRDIVLVSVSAIPIAWAEQAGISFVVLFLAEAHLIDVVTGGILLSLLLGSGAVARVVLGIVSDRVLRGRRKNTFLLCYVLTGIFSVMIAYTPLGTPLWMLAILMAFWGFVAVGWGGLYLTLIGELAGAESTGLAAGFGNLFVCMGAMAGPPIFGFIVDVTGSYPIAWDVVGILCLASIPLIRLVREERKRL